MVCQDSQASASSSSSPCIRSCTNVPANKRHPAPASINPLLVDCEGGQEECADVEVDKAQAEDGKETEVSASKEVHK